MGPPKGIYLFYSPCYLVVKKGDQGEHGGPGFGTWSVIEMSKQG